jgi:hypothetical protein
LVIALARCTVADGICIHLVSDLNQSWSSKNLWHRWTGQWKVEVINQNNQILLTKTFEYKKEDE